MIVELGTNVVIGLGYAGAVLSITQNAMRTMIPLRCLGIAANCVFVAYGALAGVYPTLLVHAVVLPLNIVRLVQMLRLVRRVREAASSDLSMDWLKPFMTKRAVRPGETLFSKGEPATCLFYTLAGGYRLRESGRDIGPGEMVGELGFVAPDNRRTQSLECVAAGEVLAISYDDLRQLYFQNPEFGFYFLRLASRRMFENLAALEAAAGPDRGPSGPNALNRPESCVA